MATLIQFPNKALRAKVIARYVQAAGYRGVVCFSCGNASAALEACGLYVVDIGPGGSLQAGQWWTPAEIHKAWPDLFDATSGHLPIPLMLDIARAYRTYLGELQGEYQVPTGSGETITCLRYAYPDCSFVPVYNLDRATRLEPNAPLNCIVSGVSCYVT